MCCFATEEYGKQLLVSNGLQIFLIQIKVLTCWIMAQQDEHYFLTAHTSAHRWNRSGFSRPDPTGKFQNLRRSTVFFPESFCALFNAANEKFSKGEATGEELKFVTTDGGLRKKTQKNFCVFCKNNSISRPIQVEFRFERHVLSSAKRAQNERKKNWRAQAKLLDFYLMILRVRPRNEVIIF